MAKALLKSKQRGRPLRGRERRRCVSFTIDPQHETWIRKRAEATDKTLSEMLDYLVDTAIAHENILNTQAGRDVLAKITTNDTIQSLTQLCHKFGIQKLSFFGSILRDDFSPASDIDTLVFFNNTTKPSLFTLAEVEMGLSKILGGRKIDLRTAGDLSRYFRDQVLKEAKTVVQLS